MAEAWKYHTKWKTPEIKVKLSYYLCDISTRGKSVDRTEAGAHQGVTWGGWEKITQWVWSLFWGWWKCSKHTEWYRYQGCEHTKKHWTVHFGKGWGFWLMAYDSIKPWISWFQAFLASNHDGETGITWPWALEAQICWEGPRPLVLPTSTSEF